MSSQVKQQPKNIDLKEFLIKFSYSVDFRAFSVKF